MIELVELKEDKAKYHNDAEEVHRLQLHIKIRNPTDKETAALQILITNLFQEIGVKKKNE